MSHFLDFFMCCVHISFKDYNGCTRNNNQDSGSNQHETRRDGIHHIDNDGQSI